MLVVRQYRHPAGHRFVELPAGLLDQPGEDPEQAARRELVEEAGYEAASWTRLGLDLQLARHHRRGHPPLPGARPASRPTAGDFEPAHEEADMELLWMPFADLLDGVLSGRTANAPLVNAVLLAHARGLVGATRRA